MSAADHSCVHVMYQINITCAHIRPHTVCFFVYYAITIYWNFFFFNFYISLFHIFHSSWISFHVLTTSNMDIIPFSKKKRIKLLSVKLLYQSKVATDLNIWCTFQYLLIKKSLIIHKKIFQNCTFHVSLWPSWLYGENIFFFRSPAFTMVSSLRTSSYLHICKFNTSLETFPNWNWYTSAKVRIWVTVIDLPAYMESF